MSSGSQDGKVSFRRLCNSHLLIFVLLSTSHLLIFILQCISHICNSYLHISLLLIISFLYFCLPLFLSYCHLCSYLYLSFSNLSSCTTPYHIFLIFVFLCIILFHIVTQGTFQKLLCGFCPLRGGGVPPLSAKGFFWQMIFR